MANDRLHAHGCARDGENLVFIFNREPTDEEMRVIHDYMNMMLESVFRDGNQQQRVVVLGGRKPH